MAARLLDCGWPLTVWNRSSAAVDALAARGAGTAAAVEGLRDHSVIIFMLPDLSFIEDAAEPLLSAWRTSPPQPETAVVVMRSVSPRGVRAFGARVSEASGGNAAVVDAPVSGGTVGAQNGTLAIMAGGT